MLLSTWKKINLARIIIFSLVYIAYSLYLVVSDTGIYIVDILLFLSAILNAALSFITFFIDDEDKHKLAKKLSKKVKKMTKLFIQALKFIILAGSFVIYADEKSVTTLALAFLMLALTIIGLFIDWLKVFIVRKARDAAKAIDKGVEIVKDALHLSDDWNVVFLEGNRKLRFKAKEDVEWWTKYTLRRKGVEDGSLVKYNGKLVFFATKDDIRYVTDMRGYEKQFQEVSKDLTDYKYKTEEVEEDV